MSDRIRDLDRINKEIKARKWDVSHNIHHEEESSILDVVVAVLITFAVSMILAVLI